MKCALALFCALVATVTVQTAVGQTPAGPEFRVNNTTTGNQAHPRVAMDAFGNFAVVWLSGSDIYFQRYDSTGAAVGGQPRVNTHTTSDKDYPAIAMRASGDFVVVWQSDGQDGYVGWGIHGQRYYNTGSPNGSEFLINSYGPENQTLPAVAMSATGSFVVVWQSFLQDGSDWGIYGQRYDSAGLPDGAEFRVNTYILQGQVTPSVAMDSSGNFAVVWASDGQDGSGYGVFRRRYNSSGTPIEVDTQINSYTSSNQYQPSVAILPSTGHLVVWTTDDLDGSGTAVYARRYDIGGSSVGPAFQVNTTTVNDQQRARVAYDSAEGFTVSWDGARQGGDGLGVVAQRFLSDGTKYGGEYQVNTYSSSTQSEADIAIAGSRQVVVWTSDGQDGDLGGIYGQRFLLAAPAADLSVSSFVSPSEVTDAKLPVDVSFTIANAFVDVDSFRTSVRVSIDNTITVDDSALATVTLPGLTAGDDTTFSLSLTMPPDGPRGDIYLGVLVDDLDQVEESSEGNNSDANAFSYQVPLIYSVKDVLGDEGGWVFLKWYASPLDAISAGGLITEYTLWRTIDIYGASPPAEGSYLAWETGKTPQTAPAGTTGKPILRAQHTASGPIFWELVDTHAAYHLEGYGRALPTLFDSTSVNTDYHYFQVMAHTSDPLVYYISGIDSSRSVDDLAPCQPQGLVASQTVSPDGLELSWSPNTEPDLLHYCVYRGADVGFTPSPSNRLDTTTDELFFDEEWVWSSTDYYKVSAVDVHGNESPFAVLGPGGVTGVGDDAPPRKTYLAQNRPNPFNPATTIRFSLAEKGFVVLAVYDARGQLVRTLERGVLTPDVYSVMWDGTNSDGAPVSSGVYFYRLDTRGARQVRKMVLLK